MSRKRKALLAAVVALSLALLLVVPGISQTSTKSSAQEATLSSAAVGINYIYSYDVYYSRQPYINLHGGPPSYPTFVLNFLPSGSALPADYESGGVVYVYYHVEDFQNTIDLLESEYPASFNYSGSSGNNGLITSAYPGKVSILPLKFDFGTATSPVETGFTQVTPATRYSDALGYGWTTIGLDSRDRGSPDSLRRDFVFSSTYSEFAVRLPAGYYHVTLLMGDLSFNHNVGIYAEQQLIHDAATFAGLFTEYSFSYSVTDGIFELGFYGSPWVINAVTIQQIE